MDFLDPRKQRAHMIRILAGYVLIGVAVLFATLILLYQAYGFGLNKDGEVIQNGLVFMSSEPRGAEIYLDGKLYKSGTNTKMQLPTGQYKVELRRNGYASWQRAVTVEGASVNRFDYPQLFPSKLTAAAVKTYSEAPGLATASPDRRWLVVQQGSSALNFDLFDTSDPKKLVGSATALALPETVVTNARTGTHSYKLVEWSTDNRHVLLQHIYTSTLAGATIDTAEYILLDRQTPTESLNLTRSLALTSGKQLSLRDKKYDRYYVFDETARTLGATSISDVGRLTPLLERVFAFKSYGANMVLYISDRDPVTGLETPSGKLLSLLKDGDQTYKIQSHGTTGPFLIDLAQYDGNWYVAVGASGDNKVYVYKNPQTIRKASDTAVLVPVRILRVTAPTHIAFSTTAQLLMIENSDSFADYDVEYDKGYNFVSKYGLDAPAISASWMGSHRLTYVSGGKLVVYDYDNINARALVPAIPTYLPFFDRDYRVLYTMAPTAGGAPGAVLTSTSLLTPADQ